MTAQAPHRRATERFLHSVLVVDDIQRDEPEAPARDVPLADPDPFADPAPAPTQMAFPVAPTLTSRAGPAEGDARPPEGREVGAVPLDTRRLTETFANLGIVCAALRPGPGNDLRDLVLKVGRRCDIVVLDWHIDSDDPSVTSLHLLDGITEPTVPGLRLVAVYTGDPQLGEIAEAIMSLAGVEEADEPFRYRRGSSHIAILSKDGARFTMHVPGAVTVPEQDLPDYLLDAFAVNATGLVPSTTLSALGAVRESVHEVLAVLGEELDTGFVGHRLALPNPDDASDHLGELVVSELASVILEDRERASCTERATVQEWLDALDDAAIRQPATRELLTILNEYGSGDAGVRPVAALLGSNSKAKTFLSGHTTSYFNDTAVCADARLAERMATVHRYRNARPPRLELGTIIRESTTGMYLVCMQPVCDCVRLTSATEMPFLPLRVVPSKPFDVTLVCAGEPVRLKVDVKPSLLRMVRFEPDPATQTVLAPSFHGRPRFKTTSRRVFELVARLKPQQAQRLAHAIGNAFSRIGLNESEWQRRQG